MIDLLKIERGTHRDLICGWFQMPHVSRWWGDASANLKLFDETPSHQHSVIALTGVPVGYVRWQEVDRDDLDAVGLSEIPDGAIDIDLFIGSPQDLNKGLGPTALEMLADHLSRTTTAPLAGLCTSVENGRAIHAFGKAGFHKCWKFDDPTFGPCWVMVRWL